MSQHGVDQAEQAARRAANSNKLETAARVGFAVNGVMHLLIGWIALQVAWSGSGKNADQSGALGTLAGNGAGKVVLWLGVLGFAGLAVWQLTEAVFSSHGEGKDKVLAKVKAVSKAVVYAALAVTTFKYASGGGGSSSSSQTQDFTRSLMQHSGGRTLVVLIGLVVLGVGVYHVVKGVTKGFLKDLVEHPGRLIVRLAMIGYVAKGVALGIVGLLFVVAGLRGTPSRATGLDGALKTLRDQPLGTTLLTLVALGLIAYGVYSFARARFARF
jgi:hypothetical protein